jgi:hypothetical protein
MAVTQEARSEGPAVGRGWQSRFARLKPREWWGYAVWGFVGALIAVSELWAAAGNPWWPTISATVGHLERLWSPVKIIVVALIAAGAVQVLTNPPFRANYEQRPGRALRRRTENGRLTKSWANNQEMLPLAAGYFPAAVIAVAAAAAGAAILGGDKFVVGYVLYGVMAIAFLIIPNVLAFFCAREVPFPTLLRTLEDLDSRLHSAVLIIVAGLVVLVIHLVAYPWP